MLYKLYLLFKSLFATPTVKKIDTAKAKTMVFKLNRTDFHHDGVFGVLLDADDKHIAYTLEHAYDSAQGNGSYTSKIPNGTYTCVKGTHKLHNTPIFTTFEIIGVPGHKGILFHAGNFNDDSEGCVLLGTGRAIVNNADMITCSKVALEHFLSLTNEFSTFTLIVT